MEAEDVGCEWNWAAVSGTDRSIPILLNLPKAWFVLMWLCQPDQRINGKVVMGGPVLLMHTKQAKMCGQEKPLED